MATRSAVRILFVRHGEAESDRDHRLSYIAADQPLTEHGRNQAQELTAALKAQNIPFHSQIMSSPSARTQETADILASGLGLSVVGDERLRQINIGELDGRADEEAWREYTEIVHRRWAAGEWSRRFPGGEHLRNLAQRLRTALHQAARSDIAGPVKSDVLVVGHGTGLRAALPYLIKNVEGAYPHEDMAQCAVTCLLATPPARPAVIRMLAWGAPVADLPRLAANKDRDLWNTF